MQFFEEKHCYVKNNSYICHRVSSTLRVGVRFNGSNLVKRELIAYPSSEIWTISTNEDE